MVLFGGQNNGECLGVSYQTCKDNNNVDKNGTEYKVMILWVSYNWKLNLKKMNPMASCEAF